MTTSFKCHCCDTAIELTDYGWVHAIGGGARMEKCIECGWKGNKPGGHHACPECGSTALMDDHFATV